MIFRLYENPKQVAAFNRALRMVKASVCRKACAVLTSEGVGGDGKVSNNFFDPSPSCKRRDNGSRMLDNRVLVTYSKKTLQR